MIIYTLIGRESDGAVLVESSHAGVEGNYPLIATQLLEKLRDDPNLVAHGNRKTFTHREDPESGCNAGNFVCSNGGQGSLWDMGKSWFGGFDNESSDQPAASGLDHYFHVLHGESAFYICLSDDTGRQAGVNFNYLEDLQRDFASYYTPNKINRANAYGMNKAFSKNIEKLSHHYNTNRSTMATDQRIAQLNSQMDDLKNVVGNNISLILQRGDSITRLATKTEQLEQDATIFKKRSTTLKRKMCWENLKTHAVLIGVVMFLLFLLSFMVCGAGWDRCRATGGGGGGDGGDNNEASF